MKPYFLLLLSTICAACASACSDDSSSTPPAENTGSTCTSASQCYPAVDASALLGNPICMTKVTNGYCTHTCTLDTDCCAVPGECTSGHPQVCSPFESTSDTYCLLSCEDAQVADAGVTDSNAYCDSFAHSGFKCRSSGGGSKNRKVCMPE